MIRNLTFTAALAVTIVLAGCGGSKATTTTTSLATSAPATETTPSSPPASDPNTPSSLPGSPTGYTATGSDATNELRAAWESGDRKRAANIASAQAVEAIFKVPTGGFEVYGCDTGEFGTSTCNLRNRSTGLYLVITSVKFDQGWQVESVEVSTDG